MKNYPVPAVVSDMLLKLNNTGLGDNERDNVALTLESIEQACKREVTIYRRERAKQHRDGREQRRRDRRPHA